MLNDILNELLMALDNVQQDLDVWVNEIISGVDPIKKLTKGMLDMVI